MKLSIIENSVVPAIDAIIRALSPSGKKQLLTVAGQEFLRETKDNFGNSGPYREKKWAPLSKSYANKVGRTQATLQISGALKDSIKMQVKSNSVLIYTQNKYAAAQAFGYKPRNLPPRNYWPMQNFGNPNYTRLQYNSERVMFKTINQKLNILSNNQLPIITQLQARMAPQYGNVFTIN